MIGRETNADNPPNFQTSGYIIHIATLFRLAISNPFDFPYNYDIPRKRTSILIYFSVYLVQPPRRFHPIIQIDHLRSLLSLPSAQMAVLRRHVIGGNYWHGIEENKNVRYNRLSVIQD